MKIWHLIHFKLNPYSAIISTSKQTWTSSKTRLPKWLVFFVAHQSYAANAKKIGLNLKTKVTYFLLIRTSLQFIGFFKKVVISESNSSK